MIAGRATTRLARGRRRGGRLALGAAGGVFATGVLLAAMASLAEHLVAEPPPPLPPLSVLREPPPPPLPPPRPEEPPPPAEPPVMPTIPAMEIDLADTVDDFTLPPMDVTLDAIPVDPVIALPATAAPSVDAPQPSRAAAPRRLFVPDLQRFYPRRLARRGIEGRSRVRAEIDVEGRVTAVEILESEPPGSFDQAARRALETLRYDPATDAAGKPIPGVVEETLVWTLDR